MWKFHYVYNYYYYCDNIKHACTLHILCSRCIYCTSTCYATRNVIAHSAVCTDTAQYAARGISICTGRARTRNHNNNHNDKETNTFHACTCLRRSIRLVCRRSLQPSRVVYTRANRIVRDVTRALRSARRQAARRTTAQQ